MADYEHSGNEKKDDSAAVSIIAIGAAVIAIAIIWFVSLNAEQENYLSATKISKEDYLKFACKAKSVCPDYAEIRISCAEAGSIQKCIEIRMRGDDYSVCTDDGKIIGIDDKLMPSFAQCTGHKIFSFVNRK